MSSSNRPCLLLAAGLALALAAPAPAVVPGQVDYQGLLLDDQGQPVNGSVDFVFTLYDAPSGGSPLWTEAHPGVSVLDGVYDAVLGGTTPLTPDLVSGGSLYLEIEVDGETLEPRQRLVAVPYALRAASVESVGSAPEAFVTQIYENFAFDGAEPANDDPSEGLADTDADGLVNFLDADNDGDGIPDGDEVAEGSDINLVTPTIAALDPPAMAADGIATVTVQGTSFEPGMSVVFGSQTPAPQNLSGSSFDVEVGPQPAGSAVVQVTRTNGESASAGFDFVDLQPLIIGFDPPYAVFDTTSVVTVNGTGFGPGLQVSFGSESPVPQSLTSTSFQVSVGPQSPGPASVSVSYAAGSADSEEFFFSSLDDTDPRVAFISSAGYTGDLGGAAGADAKCAALASAASLTGGFRAFLGDDVAGLERFVTGPWHYERVDAVKVADDLTDFTNGTLDAPLDKTETGGQLSGFGWAGFDGEANCNGWTSDSSADSGEAANSSFTTSPESCNLSLRLYCLQQF